MVAFVSFVLLTISLWSVWCKEHRVVMGSITFLAALQSFGIVEHQSVVYNVESLQQHYCTSPATLQFRGYVHRS
jgi:hypothetical protein